MPDFPLDPRLVADSYPLTELPLCQLRLMDDTRYLWLILIPRRAGISEVFELSVEDQHQMWREAAMIGKAVKAHRNGDKLNIASLGNMVPQLHLHVIVRHQGDAAWPGPVWGQGAAEPYDKEYLAEVRERVLSIVSGMPF
ncbi:HIT domain-containing protein [Halomonas cupida]|uniref:HIT domain-containing protein n=1 Tax=Halomonas cupida TaxID=44933 RepID=UPI003A91A5E7